jgi:hypothetical protein
MNLVRRFLSAALTAAAEEVEPAPEVIPWPWALGFVTTALGAIALGLVRSRVDDTDAKLRALGDVDAVVRGHRTDLDKHTRSIEALKATVGQLEAHLTLGVARPVTLDEYRADTDGNVVRVRRDSDPLGQFALESIAGEAPRSGSWIAADVRGAYPIALKGAPVS